MKRISNRSQLLAVIALAAFLAACNQPPEVIARDAIVGAKAALDSEKAKHPECAGAKTGFCGVLSKATGAKDAAIDSLEVYCSGPSFDNGGACNPPASGTPAAQQALDKLKAAVANMNQTIADVKKAGGGN